MENCRWCGARIPEGTTVCPDCGVRLRREAKRCPSCKRGIRVGLAICPYCGEDLARRRIPWKLIASLGGLALAVGLIYAIAAFLPLPINLPLIAAPPSPTPTEVILPPTATPTETPRPPTATPTATATFTPVITITATITPTVAAVQSPVPTNTPAATPTEPVALRHPAPRLISPADGEEFSGSGTPIELRWEAVGTLRADEWYEIRLSYLNKNDELVDRVVAWVRNDGIPWRVGESYYDDVSLNERTFEWQITIIWDPEGDRRGQAVSPPSETRMFRWE